MIRIFYSEEDEGYIAIDTDVRGTSGSGETKEKAFRELKTVITAINEILKKSE